MPSFPMRLASFCDYMIDYTATLSLEAVRARARGARADIEGRASGDYERAPSVAGAAAGGLAEAVAGLKQQNLRLQRLHNQDRALLLKQSEMIRALTHGDALRD